MSDHDTEVFTAPPNELMNLPTVAPTAIDVEPFARAAASLDMFNKLREIALKLCRPSDFHMFGDRPWPQRSACEKIMRACGLNVKLHRQADGTPFIKKYSQDEKGGYYIITISGMISGQWGELEAMGFCSSRDQFFAREGADSEGNPVYKPLSQVNESDITQSAYTNFLANAVTRYTGLGGLTQEDLERHYGAGTVSSHTYRDNKPKQTKEATAADSEKAKRLWAILMIVTEGAEHDAKQLLKELSAFTGRDGKEVSGLTDVAKLSPGRLANTLRTAETRWEAWLKKQGDERRFFEDLLVQRLQGGSDGDGQK